MHLAPAGLTPGFGWVEFVAQAANPGSVPANTMYLDDGTNFDPNTLVWDTHPAAFAEDFSVGPVGTEQGGINVNGANYDANAKINSVGGALDATLILHRHSTSFPPNLTFARTNNDTVAHTAVALGQTLGSMIFVGWTGSHYDIGAVIDARVAPTGTISATSIPTEIAFFTTPNLSDAASLGMLLGSDQVLYGDIVAGGTLTLQGAQNTPDVGILQVNSPVTFNYDTFSNTTPAQQFLMRWAPTVAASGAYIGGALQTAAVFTVTSGVFIPAIFSDTNIYQIAAAPGFSAITFINELSVVRNLGNFNEPSALVMNIGLTHERNTAGTSTTPGTTGVSFSPQTRATVAGAVMTKTDQTALRCSVTWSTVGGSTVNMGTIRAVHLFNPAVALFQPGTGVETATAVIGVDVNNLTFGGNIVKAAVRSAHISTGTNSYFLLNNGNSVSDFGGSNIHFNDLFGILFGNTPSTADLNIGVIAGGVFFFNWTTGDTGQLRMSSELAGAGSTDRFLWTSTVSAEYTFDCDRFSLGAQTGSNGNQVGNFVAPTRSVGIGGDWSDFLLTQAGNITVNAAMGALAAWTVNAPSITLGTGSVTTGVALNVGGNPNQGTNRIGVRIISNPSGGGGVNAALWVTAGLAQFDGNVLLAAAGTNVGFYGTAPIAQQLAVPITIAAVHAALVALGLIT